MALLVFGDKLPLSYDGEMSGAIGTFHGFNLVGADANGEVGVAMVVFWLLLLLLLALGGEMGVVDV